MKTQRISYAETLGLVFCFVVVFPLCFSVVLKDWLDRAPIVDPCGLDWVCTLASAESAKPVKLWKH